MNGWLFAPFLVSHAIASEPATAAPWPGSPRRQKAMDAVSHPVGVGSLFEDEHPGQVRGDPTDGRGQDHRVWPPQEPGGDAGTDVGQRVGHHLLVALAERSGRTARRPGEFHEGEQMPVFGQPGNDERMPLLDSAGGIVLVSDGLALGQAHGAGRRSRISRISSSFESKYHRRRPCRHAAR